MQYLKIIICFISKMIASQRTFASFVYIQWQMTPAMMQMVPSFWLTGRGREEDILEHLDIGKVSQKKRGFVLYQILYNVNWIDHRVILYLWFSKGFNISKCMIPPKNTTTKQIINVLPLIQILFSFSGCCVIRAHINNLLITLGHVRK